MKKRSSLPVLVVVAVVALVFGSIGTAVAGPALTKSKVKSIATKVVKKQAPTLSVAHATTASSATNATTAANTTNLNGQPSTAFRNPSITFQLPVQAAASTRTYSLSGLSAGTYLVTYSIFMQTGAGALSDCRVYNSATATAAEAWLYGTNYSSYNTQTGSVVIAVGATAPRIFCEASVAWSIYGGAEANSRVSVTRLDDLATGTTTGTRPSTSGSETNVAN